MIVFHYSLIYAPLLMRQSNFKYIADHNCSFYIVCIALCFIFSITIPFCFLFKESFLVHFSDNAALLGYFWPSNSTSNIAVQLLVSFLQNSFFVIEIWASQPGTETTTFIKVEIVQWYIEVAGGIVPAITQIQMACTKVEVAHKELPGHYFEDKIIR